MNIALNQVQSMYVNELGNLVILFKDQNDPPLETTEHQQVVYVKPSCTVIIGDEQILIEE